MHYLNVVTANVKVTLALCMNRRHVGSGSIAPRIPYLKLMKMSDQSHTGCFVPRKLAGPQSQSKGPGKEIIVLPVLDIKSWFLKFYFRSFLMF